MYAQLHEKEVDARRVHRRVLLSPQSGSALLRRYLTWPPSDTARARALLALPWLRVAPGGCGGGGGGGSEERRGGGGDSGPSRRSFRPPPRQTRSAPRPSAFVSDAGADAGGGIAGAGGEAGARVEKHEDGRIVRRPRTKRQRDLYSVPPTCGPRTWGWYWDRSTCLKY
jgi:hypothetical protein